MLYADTLKVYSRPSVRPVQVYCVDLTTDSLAFTHSRLFLSFFSMQYPVMGLPPSLLGRSHDKMTKSLLILLICRFLGSLGGSLGEMEIHRTQTHIISIHHISISVRKEFQ